MIVIRVDLHHAVKGGVTRLLTLTLSNTGTHPQRPSRGDYRVRMGRKGQECVRDVHRNPTRETFVRDHARKTAPVIELVRKAISALCRVEDT